MEEATATCLLKRTHGCQNKTKDGTIVLLKISSPVEVNKKNKTVSRKRREDDTHLKIGTCTLVFYMSRSLQACDCRYLTLRVCVN